MAEQPTCERHGLGLYYDTYGYPACLKCEDENWETYYRHLVSGHSCDLCKTWTKANVSANYRPANAEKPPPSRSPRGVQRDSRGRLERGSMKQYFQCRLRRGDSETTGWIEARGAKAGATVELLPSRELWEVAEVFKHGLPEDVLKENQRLNRGSLPSVERMQ